MDRALKLLAGSVLAILTASILGGIVLPVYTDEVGWRFQERAGFDGVDKMFADTCGPNSLAVPPFFMWPVRAFSAFFNGAFADPFWVRVSGILYALAWLAMAVVLLRRAAPDGAGKSDPAQTIIPFGLLSLGTMPFLLVWSRPEQPVILCAVAALLVASADGSRANHLTPEKTAWLRSLAILLLGLVAASYHVKGVVALPLFLACMFFAAQGQAAIRPRLVAGSLLVAGAGWAALYWVHRLQCGGDPVLRAAYAINNMGAVLTGPDGRVDPVGALFKLVGNISFSGYFQLPAPREIPLSFWLEPRQITAAASSRWVLGLILLWGLATAMAFFALARAGIAMIRERLLEARSTLAFVLFLTVMAWSATQLIRNVYEAGFVLPLVALAIGLALPSLPVTGIAPRLRALLALVIGLAALASPFAVARIYGPSLVRANHEPGYVAAQPNSLPVFGYGKVRPDIEGAARLCGIPQGPEGRAVMVDDLTYFTMMRTRLPQHRLGVIGVWKGKITDPVAYLQSRGSSGMVVGCHLLLPELQARAKRQGKFCCLAPPNW